jgi:Tfp pilus assembly protein FimT
MRCTSGYTLVEALLTLAVLAILTVSATPALLATLDRQRLRGVAENLHSDLMLARSESLRLNMPVSLSFQIEAANGRWCYALNDAGPCDCRVDDACRVTGSPALAASDARYTRVRLATNLQQRTATFQPARGTVNAGTVTLTAGTQAVDVVLSTLGRVRLCSDQLGGYPPC